MDLGPPARRSSIATIVRRCPSDGRRCGELHAGSGRSAALYGGVRELSAAPLRSSILSREQSMSANHYVGDVEYFKGIGRIPFEGRDSDNPLAFKHYDENRRVGDRSMKEHLRFAVCYWHTFLGAGADPFGVGTRVFAWDKPADLLQAAAARMDAAFEFFTKLGVPYYCFHDRDLAPAGASVAESERNLTAMIERAGKLQKITGMRLLWGTANLFTHPRYMCGAATNPDFQVLAHAGAQVKAALDATV